MEKTDIKSLDYDELKDFFVSIGEKPFRAKQVYQWIHEKQADGFEEMTNLSKNLREKLAETCEYTCLENVQTLVSELDGTRKYLFRLSDGYVVESVLMRYQHGNSVCISTQMPFLCLHDRRKDKRSDGGGDARSDLPYPERHRGAGIQPGDDGYRRATG